MPNQTLHRITLGASATCDPCPCCRGGGEPGDGGEEMYCGADEKTRDIPYAYGRPDWCPLREGPVMVELAEEVDDRELTEARARIDELERKEKRCRRCLSDK